MYISQKKFKKNSRGKIPFFGKHIIEDDCQILPQALQSFATE